MSKTSESALNVVLRPKEGNNIDGIMLKKGELVNRSRRPCSS